MDKNGGYIMSTKKVTQFISGKCTEFVVNPAM